MHAWLALLILLPQEFNLFTTAALLALGLSMWSVPYLGAHLLDRSAGIALVDRMSGRTLLMSKWIARGDGALVTLMGLALLLR